MRMWQGGTSLWAVTELGSMFSDDECKDSDEEALIIDKLRSFLCLRCLFTFRILHRRMLK